MKTHQIVFTEMNKAELLEREIDEKLAPNQALVRAEYSVVSAGTEGASFTGLVQQMPQAHRRPYRNSFAPLMLLRPQVSTLWNSHPRRALR